MAKFKVGDKVKGINADIKDCEGFIEEVTDSGYIIRLIKVGNHSFHGSGEWKVGNLITRPTFWLRCLVKIGTKCNKIQKLKEELMKNGV